MLHEFANGGGTKTDTASDNLPGNCNEWTMEAYSTTYQIYRGGYCEPIDSSYPAFRHDMSSPDNAGSIIYSEKIIEKNIKIWYDKSKIITGQ